MATNAQPITPPQPRFADAFWDEHHYGVEAIDQRLIHAKQTCEEIKKLYEIRSQMEGDYGDRLLKLSQLIVGGDEDGTLAESLSHIPSALETTARAHMDLAQQLLHHLQSPLDNFIKDQCDLYTAKQRRIQDIIKIKSECHDHMIQAKGAYNSECDKLREIYRYLEEYSPSAEELAQAEADRDACLKNIEVTEQGYRQSIDAYNNQTTTWVDEWQTACDIYQQLEEKRIRFVRSSLWAFANMMSSVYIVDDQCCERIRTALELTDVEKDIHTFVKKHGTGKVLPGYAEFEDAMPHLSPAHGPGALDVADPGIEQQDNFGVKALPSVPHPPIDGNQESPQSQHNTTAENDLSAHQGQQPRQTEAMTFAMQAVENMLQEDANKNETSHDHSLDISLTDQHPSKAGSQDRSINDTKPPVTPQPAPLLSAAADAKRPSSVKSTESGQLRFKPVPNPAFARSKESKSVPQSIGNIATTSNDNIKKQSHLSSSNSSIDNDQQLAELISTAAMVAAGTDNGSSSNTGTPKADDTNIKGHVLSDNKDDIINLTDDEDSEDNYKRPVRPPPKDEKWVISSIRRPQMVPVRSTNAHLYDGTATSRASMIRSSPSTAASDHLGDRHRQSAPPIVTDQPGHTHDNGANGKSNRPHPPLKIDIPNKNEAKAAAQEAIAAGRAHTQNTTQHTVKDQNMSYPQQQQQQQQTDTLGIRPPPWKQDDSSVDQNQQRHQPPYNQYDQPNYSQPYSQQSQQAAYDQHQPQQQPGGLHRYGSVSGPRVAPDIITTDLDPDANGRNGKNSNEFSKFMKGVLKSNDGGRPLSGDMSGDDRLQPTQDLHSNKKEKGGRFSLGIFGNKKDKRATKDGRDPYHQKTPPSDVLISGPPGGGPVIMNNSTMNDPNPTNHHYSHYPKEPAFTAASTTVIPTTQPPVESNNIPSTSSRDHHQPLPTGPEKEPATHDQPDDINETADGTPIMHYARAIWSFTATIPLEMSFSAGDRLAIVKKQADGWWDAELQGPKQTRGLVPGNYMEPE